LAVVIVPPVIMHPPQRLYSLPVFLCLRCAIILTLILVVEVFRAVLPVLFAVEHFTEVVEIRIAVFDHRRDEVVVGVGQSNVRSPAVLVPSSPSPVVHDDEVSDSGGGQINRLGERRQLLHDRAVPLGRMHPEWTHTPAFAVTFTYSFIPFASSVVLGGKS
jgi:hypothetical protein